MNDLCHYGNARLTSLKILKAQVGKRNLVILITNLGMGKYIIEY